MQKEAGERRRKQSKRRRRRKVKSRRRPRLDTELTLGREEQQEEAGLVKGKGAESGFWVWASTAWT